MNQTHCLSNIKSHCHCRHGETFSFPVVYEPSPLNYYSNTDQARWPPFRMFPLEQTLLWVGALFVGLASCRAVWVHVCECECARERERLTDCVIVFEQGV